MMTTRTAQPTRLDTRTYVPIHLSTLRADRLLNFDLYIPIKGEMVLYRDKSLSFSSECRRRLFESEVREAFVDLAQRHRFLGYMQEELPAILQDDTIPPGERSAILYATSRMIIEEIFLNPALGENIRRTEWLVDRMVSFLAEGADRFQLLLQVTDEDYQLDSHSVNVCAFALGLGREAGLDDPRELNALGVGALLHDVGKARIDSRVMRKRAPLSHEEFGLMKRHVELGVEVLKETNVVPPKAYIPVAQHQEREDGTGYPEGLAGDAVHVFGKITAIADVFDAMTTARVYRDAMPVFDACKAMISMPLDSGLVRKFIGLLGPR